MKKTILLAALAAITTAGLMAQTTGTNQSAGNTVTVAFPTNVPASLVQAEILASARDIALQQIRRATLTQLEGVNTNLAAFDGGDVGTARQILTAEVRSAKTLASVNTMILALPSLTPRVVSATNAPPAITNSAVVTTNSP